MGIGPVSGEDVFEIIDDAARNYQDLRSDLFQYDESMDGIAYEHYCADILRRSGWKALVSKASNDQGVDILASNQRKIVAIPCKKYSNPVGNKAVQVQVLFRAPNNYFLTPVKKVTMSGSTLVRATIVITVFPLSSLAASIL